MRISLFSIALLVVPACGGGGGGGDEGAKAKLATDLVTCKNEKNQLKEQLAEAKAELEKVKAEAKANATNTLPTVELHGGAGQAPQKEGNLPSEAAVKVLKQNVGGLRTCYEKALKRKPDLQFVQSVTARFSVKNTGNAIDVSFAPHADADMEKCMQSSMEKWKFPQFQGAPVAFEIPINLVSK